MKKLIVYGTQYGTTKRYAEKFSEIMDTPCISYEEVKALSNYDVVIHFGGLYAGGVKGLKTTIKALPENTRLIIVTVGLADVSDEENINNIRRAIRRQVPARLMDNTMIFHLRGGIDYKKLNFKHKTMMTLLYNKAKKLPEEKKNAEVKAMIETFNSKVDFVDYVSLAPVIEAFQQKLDF